MSSKTCYIPVGRPIGEEIYYKTIFYIGCGNYYKIVRVYDFDYDGCINCCLYVNRKPS